MCSEGVNGNVSIEENPEDALIRNTSSNNQTNRLIIRGSPNKQSNSFNVHSSVKKQQNILNVSSSSNKQSNAVSNESNNVCSRQHNSLTEYSSENKLQSTVHKVHLRTNNQSGILSTHSSPHKQSNVHNDAKSRERSLPSNVTTAQDIQDDLSNGNMEEELNQINI